MTCRRRAAAALFLILAGCSSGIAPPILSTSPSKATLAAPRPVPTPFLPNGPTPTPPVNPSAASSAGWPAPYTFGNAPTPSVPFPDPAPEVVLPQDATTILLLGSDHRGGTAFRTDTIVAASLIPSEGLVVLLSVPRDLYVLLPGYGMSRINTAWIYGQTFGYPGGGPQMLFDTIRYNLGLRADHYALIEMTAFRRVVDLLGGIDVRVACPYTDWRLRRPDLPEALPGSWSLFTLGQGISHMSGDEALWYARARLRSSDFDRSRRQHEVLRAIYREARRPRTLARIPQLYAILKDSLLTDLTLRDVLSLAPVAAGMSEAHLRSRFVGRDQVRAYRVPATGAAVQLPDASAVRALLEHAYAPLGEEAPSTLTVELIQGDDDAALLAQERLAYAGVAAVVLDAAVPVDGRSRAWVSPGAPAEEVSAVFAALGLSAAAVAMEPLDQPGSVLRLQLGADFHACFDPTRGG